jgi:hypothetical protein
MYYETVTRAVKAGFVYKKTIGTGGEGDFSSWNRCRVGMVSSIVAEFPGWKIDGPKRIFPEWRQLCNAIAAPSTDAPKRSSWYRIRVTRSARSAELL